MRIILKPFGTLFIVVSVLVLSILAFTKGRTSAAPAASTGEKAPVREQPLYAPKTRAAGYQARGVTQPVVEYKFNETGTEATNSGWASSAGLKMVNEKGETDLHSLDAKGVSGKPGDRAFDNSAADGMGSQGTRNLGVALSIAPIAEVANLEQFTIYGWFKTDANSGLTNVARLVEQRGKRGSFSVLACGASPNSMQFDGGEIEAQKPSSKPVYTDRGAWVAFAITVDTTTSKVTFYKGSRDTPFKAVGTSQLAVPLATDGTSFSNFALGNSVGHAKGRPFDGWLDNVRLYDVTLTPEELEAVRLKDR